MGTVFGNVTGLVLQGFQTNGAKMNQLEAAFRVGYARGYHRAANEIHNGIATPVDAMDFCNDILEPWYPDMEQDKEFSEPPTIKVDKPIASK